jgi:hypothetical protein
VYPYPYTPSWMSLTARQIVNSTSEFKSQARRALELACLLAEPSVSAMPTSIGRFRHDTRPLEAQCRLASIARS